MQAKKNIFAEYKKRTSKIIDRTDDVRDKNYDKSF